MGEHWRKYNDSVGLSVLSSTLEYRLTVAQAMDLVRSAPPMCGPWCGDEGNPVRRDAHGKRIAFAMDGGDRAWWAIENGGLALPWKQVDSLDAAKSAADAALRDTGWLLDDGGE